MSYDRYGSDVLAGGSGGVGGGSAAGAAGGSAGGPARAPRGSEHHRRRPESTPRAAQTGLVVEDVETGWVGAVVRVEKSGGMHVVVLEDRRGRTRTFPLGPGFWVDGAPVVLVPPVLRPAKTSNGRTASGSRAVVGARAQVARGSRIWVEGKHDAELVEKVWGDDLRVEGVVVEMLDGVDNLAERLAEFGPTPERRVGVLVDHLVPGSKERRLADDALRTVPRGTVLVLGHPYVDVWQAVKPARVGLQRWPQIERGTEWKHGILRELGWPCESQADVARAWQRILRSVRSFADLEPSLLGRVEELIDYVTAPA
ncbi:DUF3097 domain-containing protein [Cellulomonas sp. PhB143]|uniref:DUF3097 domain-containing protein n=1 Tax=Cellulomonas sp. PhB143 TaxID=2485186 RepID=UPI00351A3852